MHLLSRILLQLILTRVVRATYFRINCTIPPEGSNFVSGPDVRSTLSILWSSLLTIFLCTWTVQHLSLPPPENENDGILKRFWQFLWRKPKWMMVVIILPEFFVGRALGELVAAYRSANCCSFMQECAKTLSTQWTITHAFYANMGGFVLRDGTAAESGNGGRCEITASSTLSPLDVLPSDETTPELSIPFITRLTNECLLRKHDCREDEPDNIGDSDDCLDLEHDCWVHEPVTIEYTDEELHFDLPIAVNTAHLCTLMRTGLIKQLPRISEDEIKDRSKEDLVVKLLALGQVLWLFIQLIDRKVSGLPSTQLEIAVLSFAVCTFLTYLLWLRKPKDIKIPTEVLTTRRLSREDRCRLLWLNSYGFFENSLLETGTHKPSPTIPNDIYNREAQLFRINIPDPTDPDLTRGWGMTYEDAGFTLGAVVFGACHCIAWNFDFPTPIEQTLWRATSVFTAAIMPLYYLGWYGLAVLHFSGKATVILASITYTLYIICRLYIIAEVFRSLFYLPPEAFLATWSSLVPHAD